MNISNMAASLAARDAGIQSSAEHAESVQPGWQVWAFQNVCTVANLWSDASFTMEAARSMAYELGLPAPPEQRAWGAVTVRLIREGIIEKTGQYAPAASSHGSAKPLYRRKA